MSTAPDDSYRSPNRVTVVVVAKTPVMTKIGNVNTATNTDERQ